MGLLDGKPVIGIEDMESFLVMLTSGGKLTQDECSALSKILSKTKELAIIHQTDAMRERIEETRRRFNVDHLSQEEYRVLLQKTTGILDSYLLVQAEYESLKEQAEEEEAE